MWTHTRKEGIEEGVKIASTILSFEIFTSVRRYLELHNGHLRSDSNQNHIGKSPGANPLDQATHSSFCIKGFYQEVTYFFRGVAP